MTNSLWVILPCFCTGILITLYSMTNRKWAPWQFVFSIRQSHYMLFQQEVSDGPASVSSHINAYQTACEWHCPVFVQAVSSHVIPTGSEWQSWSLSFSSQSHHISMQNQHIVRETAIFVFHALHSQHFPCYGQKAVSDTPMYVCLPAILNKYHPRPNSLWATMLLLHQKVSLYLIP